MKNLLALCLIAAFVIIVGAVIIYGRSLVRIGKERKTNQRLRVEEEERKKMMKERPDDGTPFIWNDKYFRMYKKGMLTLGEAINATRAEAGFPPVEFKDGEDTKFNMDDDTKTWPGPPATT